MQIEWRCFRKLTTWRVIGNFEGGGEGGLKDQTFLEEVQKLHWYSRPVGLK